VLAQEELIKNLTTQIKNNSRTEKNKNVIIESKERQLEVDALKFQREQLGEKLKQINILSKMNKNGAIPQEQLDDLNKTFNGFGIAARRYDNPKKIINDTDKIRDLKAREDYYYEKIQAAIKQLEEMKKVKETVPMS